MTYHCGDRVVIISGRYQGMIGPIKELLFSGKRQYAVVSMLETHRQMTVPLRRLKLWAA